MRTKAFNTATDTARDGDVAELQSTRSETYKTEYNEDFAARWDDLIGWDGRQRGEDGFFEKLLQGHGAKVVADIACGTGYHAITLSQGGFDVTASDGNPNMVAQSRRNAERLGVAMAEPRVVDWRELDGAFGAERFDALICLGNAFTHLFEEQDRERALKAMFNVLKPGGLAIIDHRNYDMILDNGYSSKHKYYYVGDAVDARPVKIRPDMVRFEYSYEDGAKHHLTLYPLRQLYMTHLLHRAGFERITRFGDFGKVFDPYGVDFIQQTAVKPAG
jgi:SAM-dependent methyltransferase